MSDNDLLSPTPEGDLIRRAREHVIPKLSIRAAAARIGISPEHWGNIERGYKSVSSAEPPRRLQPASAALIAKMARVIGVKPDELAAAGREDAARELEEMPFRTAPAPLAAVPSLPESLDPGPDDVFPETDVEMRRLVDAELPALQALYRTARIKSPDLSGAAVFPDTPHEAERWDRLVVTGYMEKPGKGYSPAELLFLMSLGRVYDAQYRAAAGQPDRRRKALIRVT